MKSRVTFSHELCCICKNDNIVFIRKAKPIKIRIKVLDIVRYISVTEYNRNRDKYEMFRV